jgi:hypothetical protein
MLGDNKFYVGKMRQSEGDKKSGCRAVVGILYEVVRKIYW